jgi:hypothetical protein
LLHDLERETKRVESSTLSHERKDRGLQFDALGCSVEQVRITSSHLQPGEENPIQLRSFGSIFVLLKCVLVSAFFFFLRF